VSNQNSLLEFILDGGPEIKEYFIDSKKGVDRKLKISCEGFIGSQTKFLTGSVQDFLVRANAIVELNKKDPNQTKVIITIITYIIYNLYQILKEHKFAQPDTVRELCIEAYRDLKSRTVTTQKSMKLYLANKDTEYILFKPIRMNIQAVYSQLQVLLWDNYTQDERLMINAPTPEQISLHLTNKH